MSAQSTQSGLSKREPIEKAGVKVRVVPQKRFSQVIPYAVLCLAVVLLAACSSSGPKLTSANPKAAATIDNKQAPLNKAPVIHVFVALCDNVNQGIVPVSASLGNGDNPATNLYWGAAFGVKTFFSKNKDWQLVSQVSNPRAGVLERLVFKHKLSDVYMVADAYRGKEIAQTTRDFLEAAAGRPGETLKIGELDLHTDGSADLIAYIGHNGLMDFELPPTTRSRDERQRKVIILACASQQYFEKPLRRTEALPLLWTTNLMAPEAYVLSAAIDGWIKKESDEEVRVRAAKAYHKYQNCGLKAADGLFATGW